MAERVKTQQSYGEYSRAISWYPLRQWSHLGQDRRRADEEACSQYLPAPLFVPHISGLKCYPGQIEERCWWRVSLDVVHFLPSEISLRIRGGFLEVTGKHEERPDQHGFTARCFTRKYRYAREAAARASKDQSLVFLPELNNELLPPSLPIRAKYLPAVLRLPAEADTAKTMSTLSADGILTVEAPVPETSVPALTIIPIKVEMEEEKEMVPGNGREPDHPDFPAAEDKGEVLPLEDRSNDGQSGSVATGLQQEEEEEEEETFGEPAGETHSSVSADGRNTESLQEKEEPGTEKRKESEAEVVDEDPPASSRETEEGITWPEVSQLGKEPKSEEDQELEAQKPQDQEPKDQELRVQEPEDQKPQDQEPKDQEPRVQEPEDQKTEEKELEDQEPWVQESEDQKTEEEELEDQKPEAQETKDQEPEDQKPQEQEPKDQEPRVQEPEDQKTEEQELEDQELEDHELEEDRDIKRECTK